MGESDTLLTLEELLTFLTSRGIRYRTSEVPHGTSVGLSVGGQVLYYPKRGKVLVQGRKKPDELTNDIYRLAGMEVREEREGENGTRTEG